MGWDSNRIRWKLNIIRLWNRLIDTREDRLVKKVFLYDINAHILNNKSNFATQVKQICCDVDLRSCFTNKTKIHLSTVRTRLQNKFAHEWKNSIQNMSKLDV